MPLTKLERESFLAEPGLVATLSVAGPGNRGPLAVPVWYHYLPGSDPWILTWATSHKTRLIEAAQAFTLTIARSQPTVRYLAVDGPVGLIESSTGRQLEEVTKRYLSGNLLDRYLSTLIPRLDELVTVHLKPKYWNSADLGVNYLD